MIEEIKKQVEKNKEKYAYVIGEEKITYQELWKQAECYKNLLIRQDSSPVIIYGNNSMQSYITIISCILAERPYVPIGKCTPIKRLKEIIKSTKSSIIITEEDLELDEIMIIHQLKELEQFQEASIKEIHNDILYIIFTSGSTGIPKGVPIKRKNLENFMYWLNQLEPLSDKRIHNVYNQASFSFDLSVADIYYALYNGHTLYDLKEDIQDDYETFYKVFQNIDVAFLTPTYSKLCMLEKDFDEEHYKNLKCIYFCGEVLDKKTVEKLWSRFPHLRIINAYGPTEATSAVSEIEITKEMLQEERLPIGEEGKYATEIEIINEEIVLKGDSVFSGYLGNIQGGYYQEKNKNCYKTGDIGYKKNNKLYCKGRVDNQIKYKGYRIELEEIEQQIKSIKGVMDCVVIAVFEEEKVKTIKAFVMTNQIEKEKILCELQKSLPAYMIPKTIQIVDSLPISNNKKIDRKALKEL